MKKQNLLLPLLATLIVASTAHAQVVYQFSADDGAPYHAGLPRAAAAALHPLPPLTSMKMSGRWKMPMKTTPAINSPIPSALQRSPPSKAAATASRRVSPFSIPVITIPELQLLLWRRHPPLSRLDRRDRYWF